MRSTGQVRVGTDDFFFVFRRIKKLTDIECFYHHVLDILNLMYTILPLT